MASVRASSSPAAAEKPGNQLLFSKKPREVEWQPKTLEEYRDRKPDAAALRKLGSLGADLDNEDLLLKKARAEKIRQFSVGLRQVNANRNTPTTVATKPVELTAAQQKKQRVAEFVKSVPKPKVRPAKFPEEPAAEPVEPVDEGPPLVEEVARLLARHDEEREMAARIRAQLNAA
jgi:hypothetical protein